MTVHYLDPSAWAKRHFAETGSQAIRALFRGAIQPACSRLGVIEMVAAISRRRAEIKASGKDPDTIAGEIVREFAEFRVVDADPTVALIATDLAGKHRLRALDAVHLASALLLQSSGEVVLVSADKELLVAAKVEKLPIFDPAPASS
jgi:predicted nucleic acid-binding protein